MTVPPSVVLVDDSEDLRLVVRMNFERSKLFSVLGEGSSGIEAISLVQELRPDVLLMDISMPGMDGLEALPKVREVSPQTKVVMFTGFAQQGLQERVLELGAVALLEKSFSLRALPAEVAKLIDAEPAVATPPVAESPSEPADQAADLTAEHQERFREVFEEAAIGMGTMTLAGHLVRTNKNFTSLTERAADQLVGSAYSSLLDEVDRQAFLDLVSEATTPSSVGGATRDDAVYQLEHHLAGSAAARRVRTTLAPIRDSQGAALYLFVQLQDVTEQRSTEAALREAQDQLQLVVQTVDDAIAWLDTDGLIRSWNRGAEKMYGYSSEQAVGRHIRDLYPPELQRNDHARHVLHLAHRDGRYEEEGWRLRADGARFWADSVITSAHDAAGNHVGYAKIARDVSERRRQWVEQQATGDALGRANAELQAENAGLAENAEAQAQFVATTAHELRTPIAVIADLAQMLQEENTDPGNAQVLRTMVSSSARLQRLLDDLVAAARLDAKAMTLDLRPVPLAATLRQSVEDLARRYPDKTVIIDTVENESQDDVVLADVERVGQIIDNLINNAINHGMPPVHVSIIPGPEMVEMRVVDSGAGVAEGLRDRLFDRYVTTARSGTGLGLYIVRELARAHGGDAVYRPDHDASAFVVTLPRYRAEQ